MKRLALVALVLLWSAGCGVPVDDNPRLVAPDNVPFELLSPTDDTAPARIEIEDAVEVTIYLLAGERLVPVVRAAPNPVTINDRVALLQDGPTAAEAAANIRSGVGRGPAEMRVVAVGATAIVSLPTSFATVSGPDHVLAVAQIVFTLTESPDVAVVTFELEGEPVEVPTGDGTLASSPLSRSHFPQLL